MVALIKKSQDAEIWVSGYCGSPSEIVQQFLNSGVRDLYQQVWIQTSGNPGNVAHALNELLSKANFEQITRKDIEDIGFCLGEWEYKCVGCADTREEAIMLNEFLDAMNAGAECPSLFREKQYTKLMEALKYRYPDISDLEMRKLLSAVMNLKL